MNKDVSVQQHTEVKKVRLRQLIAAECHQACFGSSSDACLEHCYDNLLMVFNECLTTLKSIGKDRNSRYIRLVFGPMEDRLLRVERFSDLQPSMQGNPDFYMERDVFDLTKDK